MHKENTLVDSWNFVCRCLAFRRLKLRFVAIARGKFTECHFIFTMFLSSKRISYPAIRYGVRYRYVQKKLINLNSIRQTL